MKRFHLFLYTILLILLGLTSRKLVIFLPDFINLYLGDILWAWMVFIGFCFLFPKKNHLSYNIIYSLIFSFGIEFSQLYQAPWIQNLRQTPARLVLGQGFLWSDLISYTIGIIIGFLIQIKLNYNTKK